MKNEIDLKAIAKGTILNMTKQNNELYNERIKICRNCPNIKTNVFDVEVCNSANYLKHDADGNVVITTKNDPDVEAKGCGCVLASKTRLKDAECPIKQW